MGWVLIGTGVVAGGFVLVRVIERGEALTGKGFERLWAAVEVGALHGKARWRRNDDAAGQEAPKPPEPDPVQEPTPEPPKASKPEAQKGPASPQKPSDAEYKKAVDRLGLSVNCARTSASKAKQIASNAADPTKPGGSADMAKAVDAAWVVICSYRGWPT